MSRDPDDTIESDALPTWLCELRITRRENAQYVEAARRSGMEVQHWIRQQLNRAALELLGDDAHKLPGDDHQT